MSLFKGRKAENIAENYLKDKQLVTLEKNYLCKSGEIDLIMMDNEELVFIEVRARKTAEFGTAAETVDTYKQKKIIASAKLYLLENPHLTNCTCRFDIFELNNFENCSYTHSWIKDAFMLNNFSIL